MKAFSSRQFSHSLRRHVYVCCSSQQKKRKEFAPTEILAIFVKNKQQHSTCSQAKLIWVIYLNVLLVQVKLSWIDETAKFSVSYRIESIILCRTKRWQSISSQLEEWWGWWWEGKRVVGITFSDIHETTKLESFAHNAHNILAIFSRDIHMTSNERARLSEEDFSFFINV